ncbi:cellulose-growth-specific protein [Thozetella sp. PMI_491]|nr:cellulose-growth-specific protein [Thozetella sp. PMI_491]
MKWLLVLLSAVTTVVSHGYVDNATINGQFYQVRAEAPLRISRKITSNGPVQNITSIDLQCGGISAKGVNGSQPAPLHAPAAAGSTVNLKWTLWQVTHMGPVLTYMARCPDTGCQDWLPGTQPVFFKIQQDGRHSTDQVYPNDKWATTPLMHDLSTGVNYTIPSCLQPGYYLVRHEIISLHTAQTLGGAELYPSCHQLNVSGPGNVLPTKLVSFPGAYRADDPGILFDVWKRPNIFSCPLPLGN